MRKTLIGLITSAALVLALPSLAATSTEVTSFDGATSVHLVRHHDHLFAMVDAADGTLDVYSASDNGLSWTQIDDSATTVTDVTSDTARVTKFSVYKNNIYMAAVNTNGQAQLWSIAAHHRPATWSKSGSAGFGDNANTAVTTFSQVDGSLVAFTTNGAGAGLFTTSDGTAWTQVGDYGLGQNVVTVTAVAHYQANAQNWIYVGTNDGLLYRADKNDLTTWELVGDVGDSVTAMNSSHGNLHVALTDSGVAKVDVSSNGTDFTQMGSEGLGNTNTTTVTQLGRMKLNGYLYATTSNSVDGAEVYQYAVDSGDWERLDGAGIGSIYSTIVDRVAFHGKDYLAATGDASAAVYRVTKQ